MLSKAFLERVQALFVEELRGVIPSMEELRSAFEKNDTDALGELAKRLHGIAGAAGLSEFHRLTGLLHTLEEILNQAASQRLSEDARTALTDELYPRALDSLKDMIDAHAHGKPMRVDHELLKRLDTILTTTKPASSTAVGPEDRPVRVLVVDDDKVSLYVIEEVLKTGGYEVYSTMDPAKAVEMVKDLTPDLVLLDVIMGRLDGFEVARRIRKDSAGALIPIILISVRAGVEDKIQGFRAGATDYLAKPFAPAELLARVSAILERTRMLKDLALRDGLTGAFNHRFMQERLDEELLRYRRTRKPFCIAMLDLDNFKQVNDQHGHQVGDLVLTNFAAELKDRLREIDVVARYGGEEFVVIMLEATAEDALRALTRVHKAMGHREMVPSVKITFSGGLVMVPRDGLDKKTLLQLADERLYEAKKAGRNRIVPALSDVS